MAGRHLVKALTEMQASITPMLGKAEYYGVDRGVGSGMGVQALYGDIGATLPLRARTDSSAAIGIAGSQGLGKFRLVECHSLRVQQLLRRNESKLLKVVGEASPADLLMKHLECRI